MQSWGILYSMWRLSSREIWATQVRGFEFRRMLPSKAVGNIVILKETHMNNPKKVIEVRGY